MLSCLQTREGAIHYIYNFGSGHDVYFTMCGKTFPTTKEYNTYEVNASIPGICDICEELVKIDEIINDNKVSYGNKRASYGNLLETNQSIYLDIQNRYISPEEDFSNLLNNRWWRKLKKLRNLKNRSK